VTENFGDLATVSGRTSRGGRLVVANGIGDMNAGSTSFLQFTLFHLLTLLLSLQFLLLLLHFQFLPLTVPPSALLRPRLALKFERLGFCCEPPSNITSYVAEVSASRTKLNNF